MSIHIDCDFEQDECEWSLSSRKSQGALWERHLGPTPTDFTGPSGGHGGLSMYPAIVKLLSHTCVSLISKIHLLDVI